LGARAARVPYCSGAANETVVVYVITGIMSRALSIVLSAGLMFGQAPGSGTIQGSVRNEVTGAGITNVHLVLYNRTAVRYETDTDRSGSFAVTGVAPGTYQSRLEKNGYASATDQGTAVIGAASGSAQMNVTMSGSVALRGHVVDADGNPVKGSTVR